MSTNPRGTVPIRSENDIIAARLAVREAANELGFGVTDVARLVSAASELARNVVEYAGTGVMRYGAVEQNHNAGLELVFEDQGPGIADLELALTPGYSTSKGLGLGLPGAKRLTDEMEIHSEAGHGTTVTLRKWLRR